MLQNEGEEAAHDPGSAPEEVQVHGPAAPLHQAVLQGGVPTGAAPLQHLGGRHQPRQDVRPGGCGGSLWQVLWGGV